MIKLLYLKILKPRIFLKDSRSSRWKFQADKPDIAGSDKFFIFSCSLKISTSVFAF